MGFLIILLLVLVVSSSVLAKLVWTSGFLAGKDHEALMWINSIDKLYVPNWQSLPIKDETGEMTEEQLKYANQVYVAAYRTALDHMLVDIVNIRREQVEAALAKKEMG